MKAILYVSKAHSAFDDAECEALLQQARERNGEMGISGYLYYQPPYFFQYIESEDSAVDELMQSIEADDRHRVINQVGYAFNGDRCFPRWTMKYLKAGDVNKLSMESMVVDDLLSISETYKNTERWQETLMQLMRTISRNQQVLENANTL